MPSLCLSSLTPLSSKIQENQNLLTRSISREESAHWNLPFAHLHRTLRGTRHRSRYLSHILNYQTCCFGLALHPNNTTKATAKHKLNLARQSPLDWWREENAIYNLTINPRGTFPPLLACVSSFPFFFPFLRFRLCVCIFCFLTQFSSTMTMLVGWLYFHGHIWLRNPIRLNLFRRANKKRKRYSKHFLRECLSKIPTSLPDREGLCVERFLSRASECSLLEIARTRLISGGTKTRT